MKTIHNGQDIIDSRDVIARIEELESDRETLSDAVTSAKETLSDAMDDTSALSPEDKEDAQQAVTDAEEALAGWEDAEELKALLKASKDLLAWLREFHADEPLFSSEPNHANVTVSALESAIAKTEER